MSVQDKFAALQQAIAASAVGLLSIGPATAIQPGPLKESDEALKKIDKAVGELHKAVDDERQKAQKKADGK